MKRFFSYILLIFIVVSCATPSAPQGGPRDSTPPKVETYEPEHLQTNFDAKTISINFNEWIQIANLKQQLIISPPIIPEPDITARKNQLKIQIKDKLQDSTTYSFYFGEAVKDNNEGNVINNLSYVFSTGDEIDSMYIAGKVVTLDGSTVPSNTFVQLYYSLEDSIIIKERPQYIYKVKEDGTFNINYLPHDTFRLFVLNDMNTNYKYDLATEWVGKIDTPVILNVPQENIEIPIVLPEDEKFKIKDFNSTLSYNILTVELNKELNPSKDTIFLQNFESENILPINNNFSSKYFYFFIPTDSSSVICKLVVNGITIDELRLKRAPKADERALLLPMVQGEFKYSNLSAYNNEDFELLSTVPIKHIVKNSIYVISGQDSSKVKNVVLDENGRIVKIHQPLIESFKGRIFFPDSTILLQTGIYADSISFEIEYTAPTEYGQMDFEIHFPSADTSYILRIYNKDKILYHEQIILGDTLFTFNFPKMLSGEYFVEVIEDLNKSGTWNGASFWETRSPEKVFISSPYKIRPNWEDTHIIAVDFKNMNSPTPSVNLLKYWKAQASKSSTSTEKKVRTAPLDKNLELVPKSGSLPDFKKN